jgi:hypothetical protein
MGIFLDWKKKHNLDGEWGPYLHMWDRGKKACIFPILNEILLKFPITWVWVMFPKSWGKNLLFFFYHVHHNLINIQC